MPAPAQGGAIAPALRRVASVLLTFGLMLTFPLAGQSRHTPCLCCALILGEATRKRFLGRLFFGDGHFHIISPCSEHGQTFTGFARRPNFFDPLPLTFAFSSRLFPTSIPLTPTHPWHPSHPFC